MSNSSSQPQTPSSKRTRRRPKPFFLVCLAFLLGLVLASVTVLTLRGGDGPSTQRPGAVTADPARTGASTLAPATPLDQAIPTTTPQGVRWQLWQTVALPFSDEAGPSTVQGDTATGYAHTPTGALIAATQTAVRYRVAQDWRAVLQASVQPGAGAEAWANLRAPLTLDEPQPGQLGQAAGFQFLSYTPERAVIQYVAKFQNGTMQMVALTVAWDGSDWKLVLTDDGGTSATAVPINSLAGFIPWGGV